MEPDDRVESQSGKADLIGQRDDDPVQSRLATLGMLTSKNSSGFIGSILLPHLPLSALGIKSYSGSRQ